MDFVPRGTGVKRVATLDGEANVLLGRVSAFGRAIRFNSISQSLQPVHVYTFSMSYTPHEQLTELASLPDGN